MDAIIKKNSNVKLKAVEKPVVRPSREEAEEAVRTLILWAGDDPAREGLLDTPRRVVKAYEEFFAGYNEDPEEVLSRTFEEVEGYDDMVVIRDIDVESHCEHHEPHAGKDDALDRGVHQVCPVDLHYLPPKPPNQIIV